MSGLHRALPHLFSLYTCFSDELISSHGLTSVLTFTTSLAQQSSPPTPGEHLAQSIVHAQEASGAGAGTSQGCREESGGWALGLIRRKGCVRGHTKGGAFLVTKR